LAVVLVLDTSAADVGTVGDGDAPTNNNRKQEVTFVAVGDTGLTDERDGNAPNTNNRKRDEALVAVGDTGLVDERTYLDLFGEAAKEFLTRRIIPKSNPKYRWDWTPLQVAAQRMRKTSEKIHGGLSRKFDDLSSEVKGVVQGQICQDVKRLCDLDHLNRDPSPNPSALAWQERLFCGDIIQDCN